jgi:hypothetical protein
MNLQIVPIDALEQAAPCMPRPRASVGTHRKVELGQQTSGLKPTDM